MLTELTGAVTPSDSGYVKITAPPFTFTLLASAELLVLADSTKRTIFTRLFIREPELTLFGFASQAEAKFFDELNRVSGVGPKSAMAILAAAPLGLLIKSIRAGDDSLVSRAAGVGKKSAKKIVLELQDRLPEVSTENDSSSDTAETSFTANEEVIDALVVLGFREQEARDALGHVGEDVTGLDNRLRAALKLLNKISL